MPLDTASHRSQCVACSLLKREIMYQKAFFKHTLTFWPTPHVKMKQKFHKIIPLFFWYFLFYFILSTLFFLFKKKTWSLGDLQCCISFRYEVKLFCFFKYNFIYLFYFCLCWVYVAVLRLSPGVVTRDYSVFRCTGFSLQWLFLWSTGPRGLRLHSSQHAGSGVVVHQIAWCTCYTCDTRVAWSGMWNLCKLETEPVSPGLAGRFFSTDSPGESGFIIYIYIYIYIPFFRLFFIRNYCKILSIAPCAMQ